MARTLRLATAADPPGEISMAEAIDGLARECAAAAPACVLIAWETADGKIEIRTLPQARAVRAGMTECIYEVVFPPPEVE
jgi:hypothetical protein